MAKKRNSKKRRNAKPAEIREMIVKDLISEITKDTVDMEPVEETASVISPIESAVEEVNSATLAEPMTSSGSEISIEHATHAESAAVIEQASPAEPATATDPVATTELTESVESVIPAVSEPTKSEITTPAEPEMSADPINSTDPVAPATAEPEITEPPKAEVTDFTLVMDPADVNKQVETDAEKAGNANPATANAENANPETANAENAQLEAEYAAARATGPVKSTAITPIIPVTGYGDAQNTMSQNHESNANAFQNYSSHGNNAKGKSSRAGHFKAAAANNAGKVKGIFDKPVTRKFLAAALGLTLVLNGAIAAGIMSLYSHGIKKDVSAVRETVSELESRSGNSGDFGNGGPGMGMTPPDMNNDGSWGDSWGGNDSWNNDGNYLGREDSDYGEHWDDDWDDDDWSGESAPYAGNDQGQASNSGVSIGIVISDNNGVYVTQVTGSNAQKAGFQAGDKIVSFDGDDISNSNELIEEVQEHKAGDTVKVVVERNGKQVKIKTTLE